MCCLSRPCHNQAFERLALAAALAAKDVSPRSGRLIIDINTIRAVEWLRFEHTIDEVYGVAILPGVRQPKAIVFRCDDIKHAINVVRAA
jgi:hypothetical protein